MFATTRKRSLNWTAGGGGDEDDDESSGILISDDKEDNNVFFTPGAAKPGSIAALWDEDERSTPASPLPTDLLDVCQWAAEKLN